MTTSTLLVTLSPALNLSVQTGTEEAVLNITSPQDGLSWCGVWRDPQHVLFQLANTSFLLSYLAPSSRHGILFMHATLILGFLLFCTWAWNIICAADIFTWNLLFMFLNVGQLIYIVYQMRPVNFDEELEESYQTLFYPFKVSRLSFKKMMNSEYAQIMSLHAGEAYALQNLTRTDRLGLLISGKVNVMSDHQFLHHILPCEFLDSPEFESSRANTEDKFKVSIVAASSCRYVFWLRTALDYLFVKEPYLATVLTTLIARDITTKLYTMNTKIVTTRGSHLDIRLPSISSVAFGAMPPGEYKGPPKSSRRTQVADNVFTGNFPPTNDTGLLLPNGRLQMEPLRELPSQDDLPSTAGVQSWLETSSRYHGHHTPDNL